MTAEPQRLVKLPQRGDVQSGGPLRLSRNLVFRSQVRRRRRRELDRHQRHHRHARGWRNTACAGDGGDPILGFGRNREVLAEVKALAPGPHRYDGARRSSVGRLVARAHRWRRGRRAAGLLRARGRGHDLDAVGGLKRGGVAINIGALSEPLPLNATRFMNSRLQYRGSNWFTTGEAQLMAEMVGVGVFDLSRIVNRPFRLEGINEALACVRERPGGICQRRRQSGSMSFR